MKNIYLLPTGESRLSLNRSYRDFNVGTEAGEPYWIYSDYKHFHSVTDSSVRPQHMYITNDEEIKEGDWCLYLGLSMTCFKLIEIDDYKLYWGSREYFNKNLCKKIILTTDPKLIEDGIQSIPDEFLEWFVKNPSCESVETYRSGNHYDGAMEFYHPLFYTIIIPKEPTLTITLNKEEVRGLLNCIIRTSAKGKDLDIGEMVEDKLVEFLNS